MMLLIVGFVLGALVAAATVQVYLDRRVAPLRGELGFLNARLRSLVRLSEAGLLQPTSVEAANLLNQIHDLVMKTDGDASTRSASDESGSHEIYENDDAAPLFQSRPPPGPNGVDDETGSSRGGHC